MRATCETCGQVQPPDWKPGDLCGNCGNVVRREKRCHWCVKLTPDGKFCRHCGAGQVPDEQYGAARWLKSLGADQFAIPERLAAMDPDQVEHFTRLYQKHAIVVERHVSDIAFAESFARQRGWARLWEETLLPMLPMKEAELADITLPPLRGTTDLEKLLEIRETSPLPVSRLLSALARIRIWQLSTLDYDEMGLGEDMELAISHLKDPEPSLRLEVSLTLSHWRFTSTGFVFSQRDIESNLQEAMRGPAVLEAGTSLALMTSYSQGEPQGVYAEALASENQDIAFAAALANYSPEPLLAALRVPRCRFAAAAALTKARVDFDLAAMLPTFDKNELDIIWREVEYQKRPRPDLRAYFIAQLANPATYTPTRNTLRELLALDLQPGDAARLLRDYPDRSFGAKLLKNPALTPPDLVELCREYVALDLFEPHNFPNGEYPSLPLGFVQENWRSAPATSLHTLRVMAEGQLKTGTPAEAQTMHKFLRGVMWEEAAPLAARQQAIGALNNWYEGYHQSPSLALAFTEESATLYFGSFEAYVEYFIYGINHLSTLISLEADSKFLRPLDKIAEMQAPDFAAEFWNSLLALPAPLQMQFQKALVKLAREYTNWGSVNEWAVKVLDQMQTYPAWRQVVRADLATLSTELDYGADWVVRKALRTFPEPLNCALAYSLPMASGGKADSYGAWQQVCPDIEWKDKYEVEDQLKELQALATDLASQVSEQQIPEPEAYDRMWAAYPQLDRDNLAIALREALAAKS